MIKKICLYSVKASFQKWIIIEPNYCLENNFENELDVNYAYSALKGRFSVKLVSKENLALQICKYIPEQDHFGQKFLITMQEYL